VNNRRKGAQGARNTGLLLAKGEWLLFFDSDDYMYPDYLDSVSSLLVDGNNMVVCYGQMIEEKTGKVLGTLDKVHTGSIFKSLLNGECYVTMSQTIVRKSCIMWIGLMDERCPSHQEWDTHLRLSRLYEYQVIPEVLWDYYVGRGDTISVNKEKHVPGLLYVMTKNIFYYRTVAYRSLLKKTRMLWEECAAENGLNNRNITRFKIMMLVPELSLVLGVRRVKKWTNHFGK
jgi:glycosyltransferase involved in cell wall biosynthesis